LQKLAQFLKADSFDLVELTRVHNPGALPDGPGGQSARTVRQRLRTGWLARAWAPRFQRRHGLGSLHQRRQRLVGRERRLAGFRRRPVTQGPVRTPRRLEPEGAGLRHGATSKTGASSQTCSACSARAPR